MHDPRAEDHAREGLGELVEDAARREQPLLHRGTAPRGHVREPLVGGRVAQLGGELAVSHSARQEQPPAFPAAGAAVLLGAAQVASGGEQLYPWRTTSAGAVVGFFANRNHLATLCLIAIPFMAVLGARAVRRGSTKLHLWAAALSIGLLVVALGIIRSRTGIVLLGPVLICSLLAGWTGAGNRKPRGYLLATGAVSAAAIAVVAAIALPPIIERFDRLGSPEGRLENWPIVAQAAEAYLPFGSGFGSFDAVFRSVEPLGQLDPTFFNQAHNDYLETWLEGGLLGGALIVAFLVWFGRRAWQAWRETASTHTDLRRASTIGLAVVLAHSAVDYPLRPATIATIFALMCGLLEPTTAVPSTTGRGRRRT